MDFDIWGLILNNYAIVFLIFLRTAGMVVFNPFFSRSNIPPLFKGGLILFLSLIIAANLDAANLADFGQVTTLTYMVMIFKELFIGFVIGFVLNLFVSLLLLAGEIMDLQMALGMAKVYDPASNVSMPLMGSILNFLFMLLFFAVNGHLTLIKIFTLSYNAVPVGVPHLNLEMAPFFVSLLGSVTVLILKLAFPLVAAEILIEMCMGILMKAIPQINVFSLNLPIKLLLGLAMILILLVPTSNFMDHYITLMFENVAQALKLAVAT